LLEAAKALVDDPSAAAVTEVGGWGPWIVGGGWLTIAGSKVDLLYRPIESVEKVISVPGRAHQHGLSAGAPAWLLLGDLDGRSRALPSASRSSWPYRRA
jgi:hypothetical protein